MRKIILLIFALLIVLPICSAQENEIRFYHEVGENLTIYEKCRFNGARCDTSFSCFLTVLSPAQILIIDNETMNGPGVYYNFTLNETQTSENGIHEATVDCTNSTDSGSNTFIYQNTPNGSKPIDEGQGIILLSGVALLIIFALFLGWFGFRSKNGVVGLALISMAFLLFVFAIGMITNIFQLSFGTFSEIVSNYSTLYVLFITLISIGGFGLVVWLVVFALKLYWKNRGMTDVAFPK